MASQPEKVQPEKAEGKENVNGDDDSGAKAAKHLPPSSSHSPTLKRANTTPQLSTMAIPPLSATASPQTSREGSPTRPPLNPTKTALPRATRSRKNSQDLSPGRTPGVAGSNIPSVPSAAAIQRALSVTGASHLPPTVKSDPGVDVPRPQKSNKASITSPHQAGSHIPRLTSPQPSASSSTNKSILSTSKNIDHSQSAPITPTIIVDHPVKKSIDPNVANEDPTAKVGMRTPTRATSGAGPSLETVQESSVPAAPAIATKPAQGGKGGDRPDRIEENPTEEALGSGVKEAESRVGSGNESAGNKSGEAKAQDQSKEKRQTTVAANSAKPPAVQTKKSFSQLPFTKGKTASEGSVRNMTVETETVSSIPQVALGGGTSERNVLGRAETGGSLHLKPSNETIRPKKEKKKLVRKAPSLNASSKADIFEAKVASAVDQTNSSDSEETFVYESNPPEPHSARTHRFHSRTPSATSTISQRDHYGVKGKLDGHHSVVGKKSMKFASNYNSIGYGQDGDGTVRGPSQNLRNASGNSHHHHIGRYGRGGHASLFDSDSPFPNATKPSRSSTSHLNMSPRNGSPRSPHLIHVTKSPRKAEELSYDLEGDGADDERAPLIGSMRTGRNRRRPIPGSMRPMYSEDSSHRLCSRVTAFTTLGSVLAILIAAIVAICILTSKSLVDVHINRIENVLASEQELMLDLHVHAVNPNIIAVQISDMDIDIFAKSKHSSSGELWRGGHPRISRRDTRSKPDPLQYPSERGDRYMDPSDIISHLDGVDEGNDPIYDDDPASDSRLLKIGKILKFDSPLIFNPSPFQHRIFDSTGEIRLDAPGNGTQESGNQRWKNVIEYDFELIVRGVMKYTSPISSRVYSTRVAGRTVVHPSDGLDDQGNMRLSKPSWPYEPGSNVILGPPNSGIEVKVRLRI